MSALKQRHIKEAAGAEAPLSASASPRLATPTSLERAVEEAERDLAKGHSVDHAAVREKLRRWASGEA